MLSRRFRSTIALVIPMFALAAGPVSAQNTPDQAAQMLLTSARKGYNDKQYSFAAARFREFLQKFGGHKEASGARYGLALAILDGPEKDRNLGEATQLLTAAADDRSLADRPYAVYFLGQVKRAQGMADLATAAQPGKGPAEILKFQKDALPKFEAALTSFNQALALLKPLAKDAAGEKGLPESWEWVARARADVAEMQLRVGKVKDAQATAEPFVKDPVLSRSRSRDFGRYCYAHAAFLQNDLPTAQKTLTMLAPFASPEWGTHARYLLARTHHLAGERADASVHYEGVLADHKKAIENAKLLAKDRNKLDADPVMRRQVDAVLRGPVPDHIARSTFYLGVLLYEASRFAEAKARFQEFAKNYSNSPLKGEADLRVGYCQVQLKEFAEAQKTLMPLTNDGKLVDQAFFWLGKAAAGGAPDRATKPKEYNTAIHQGIYFYGQALHRTGLLNETYTDAKARKGEIRLETADLLQMVDENKRAAGEYQAILSEKLLPDRDEEVIVRLAQAQHLAKDFAESDATCQAFAARYPQSSLLPAIAFTFAENAYFKTLALEKSPLVPAQAAERARQLAALQEETIKRTEDVLKKYPEYPKILLVRHSLALTHYRKSEIERALKEWEQIPSGDRSGELAAVPYLMADCILRQVPVVVADDALAVGKLDEQLKSASDLLVAYLGGAGKTVLTPDALLKLGYCQQRSAGLLAQAAEKQKMLQAARATYDAILKGYATHPLAANARFERAKVMALQGDVGGAFNELNRFTQEPLRQAKVAPMAVISLATMLRAQNRPNEAIDQLQKISELHHGAMLTDPDRASWIPVIEFHRAVALQEAGKFEPARWGYEIVIKEAPKTAEGTESLLRLGQCLKLEGAERFEGARKLAGKMPVDQPAIGHLVGEGTVLLNKAIAHFEKSAAELKTLDGPPELRARLLYEAAWTHRVLADREIEAAKKTVIAGMAKKGKERAPVDVPLSMVPVQPAEKQARAAYKSLIDQVGDVPLSIDARFELAEMMAQRDEIDPALALLSDALDKEPTPELTDKIRLRIGSIQGAKGNVKAALAQFEAVAAKPKSPLVGWANYRAAEVFLQNKQYGEAVKRLVPFRDNGQFNNIPGLTDRALLRLGHAYASVKAWPESQQAMEKLVNQFGSSPWVDEARYGRAWARQQLNDLDGAIDWYGQVANRSATELAARAQYQIGTCRMRQKKWNEAANAFLVVPTTFDYPELSAASLLEAAQAYRELDQRDQATRLLQRIVREYANSPFADLAKEQLEEK